MDTIRHESFQPAPYITNRKEWIICDGSDPRPKGDTDFSAIAGLAILVQTGVTNREQAELIREYNETIDAFRAWIAEPADTRSPTSPLNRQRELIAPYIIKWNEKAETIDGDIVDIPPPAEAGPDAFEAIGDLEETWIIATVLGGYTSTGKARRSRKPSGDSGATIVPFNPAPAETDPNPPPN